MDDQQQMLLSYYETNLSRTFTIIDDSFNGFRHLLIKMALFDTSSSSNAVLQAIYALSAYRLNGPSQSVAYKVEAINFLTASMKEFSSTKDSLQTLAASMLLCLYEVRQP